MDETDTTWFDQEVASCHFADERLQKRLCNLLGRIRGAVGKSISQACHDWAQTKAAYWFFSNDWVERGRYPGRAFYGDQRANGSH